MLLDARAAHTTWGPRKLRAWLLRQHPELPWPAPSTIGALLAKEGLTRPRTPRRRASPSPQILPAGAPNETWCLDFKGWWRALDGTRCDPLTATDLASRCRLLERTHGAAVRVQLERCFREYGLPLAIRSDNGSPFASSGFGGMTALSIWWVRLGIRPERIEPGKPQQNGQHERMHGTLQAEVANTPSETRQGQQRALNLWREEFNQERPHEALGQQTPASCYAPSPRTMPSRLREPEYPKGWLVRRVRQNGELSWGGERLYVSEALAGQTLGFEELPGGYWRVYLSAHPLGLLNDRTKKLLAEPKPKSPQGQGVTKHR